MKKILLFGTLVSFSLGLSAQTRVLLPKEKLNHGIQTNNPLVFSMKEEQSDKGITLPLKILSPLPVEHTIGNTLYDLQSNRLLQNRIYRYDDGSIGGVWTRGMYSPPDFPDRGTGYNFFDSEE